jgi:hypothetical protein
MGKKKTGVLWNSTGATTSTVMIGSRILGPAALNASRKAPMVASRNASSEESTAWNAPSFRMSRQPVIGLPDSDPFSNAS